jgi:hypothetical protein
MIIKPLGVQISIGSANTVANSVLVRVYNGGSAGVLNVGNYANLTLASSESVIIEKAKTDTIQGTDMLAIPVGYRS